METVVIWAWVATLLSEFIRETVLFDASLAKR